MEMMPWGTKDLTHRSTEIISISLITLLLLVREKDRRVPTVHAEGSGSERVI